MANFDQFQQEWLTSPPRRVADPLLAGDHPYQCVSLVKQGLAEIDGLSMTNSWWGNAIDYWTKTNPAILATRQPIATQDVQRGDVVVLRTNGTNPGDFSGYGHIGYATGQQNATQFELLEQNGATGNGLGDGGDAIRTRWIPKGRIAGVLRGKLVAPYTITPVDPYKRDVLEGHQKWDLDQPNFEAVANNPILTLNQQTTITVAAELHHHSIPQYTYLLEDPNVPQGYNQLDTVAYVIPAPVYVPPAAPVPVKLAPKVELVTEVPYYENSTNAKTAYKEAGRLKAGNYYQISTDFGMWNLSSDNMKDLQHWVNPKDNVVVKVLDSPPLKPLPQPVEVPTPQSSIGIQPWFNRVEWFNEQHMPVPYLTTRDTTIKDYSGTRPEVYPLSIGHELKVYGTIIDNMGIKYYLSKLPNSDAEFLYRYAVPMVDPESGRALLLKKATKPVRNRDHVSVIASELEELGLQFIDFVPRYWKRLETKIIKKG